MKQALDLSNYDWPLTAAQVQIFKDSHVEAVIVGCQKVDAALGLVKTCRAGGLPVAGLYAYLYWGFDVAAEVAKALQVAQETGVKRIWLDCEQQGEAPNVTVQIRLDQLRQCVAAVEKAGLEVGIYTGQFFWRDCMADSKEFAHFPLWHAAYMDDRRIIDRVAYGGWTSVAIHQYASTPELAGRNRDYDAILVDLDRDSSDEVPVTRREYEDLLLALASGGEDAKLSREERLKNAKYRVGEAAAGRMQSAMDFAASAVQIAKKASPPAP